MRALSVLGSTGSIGRQTLEVLYNPFKAFLCLFFYICKITIQPATCKQSNINRSLMLFQIP